MTERKVWPQRKRTASSIVISGGQEDESKATPGIIAASQELSAKEPVLEEINNVSDPIEKEFEQEEIAAPESEIELDVNEDEDVEEEQAVSEDVEDEPVKDDKKREPIPDKVQQAIDKRIAKEVAKRKALEEENRLLKASAAPQAPVIPPEFHQIVGDDWVIRPDTKERVEMPKAADYNGNVAQYMEDMAKWNNLRQRVGNAVISYHQKQQGELSKQQRIDREYDERVRGFINDHPDFLNAINTPEQNAFERSHPWVVNLLKESEHGAGIVYRLSKHKDLLRQMSTMSPSQVAKEIGKLEALEEMAVKPRSASSAPKPISSSAKSGGKVSADLRTKSFEDLSISELRKRMQPNNRRR